jgi:Fe2+ or Zn2+ uptake regulation protein
MNKLKDNVMRAMNAIMLDCEKATLYATQNELNSLGCVKRIQLKMHMATCVLCRTFAKQSKIIIRQTSSYKEIDSTNLKIHLSEIQKDRLNKTIDNYLHNE